MTLTYCGSCGSTLNAFPARIGIEPSRRGLASPRIAAPDDEPTHEGQFQVRCRELIAEIQSLGFTPWLWIEMINSRGAVEAAKSLLADRQGLAATPWLVERGRQDLTMEYEIGKPKWDDLFSDDERSEAARRLVHSGTGLL